MFKKKKIMKKIYLVPTTEIVHIQTTGIMTQSQFNIDSNESNSVESVDDLLSRESYSLWDDED